MQTLAAYVIFLLVVIVVGLAIIVTAMIALAISAGIACVKSCPEFGLWERSVVDAFACTVPRIENECAILGRAIRVQLFHVNQWMKQAF